ncbi:MAG TPA: phytanoyl-CoA dioxygenase family protein [Campylobacterales bacterium]|nr:phytanoyl-CoA dioxygenase family protein [Campylobacterales bacterium]
MTLIQQELEEFDKNGFLVLRNFLEKEECQAILDVALVHLKHKVEPIESEIDYDAKSEENRKDDINYNSIENKKFLTVRRLRQVYDRDILFKNWMENKKIRPILKQLLHDEVVLATAHHNSIMTKMPKASKETSWHQDRRYWSYSDDNLVSVWLALGDENSHNGVLEFIPSSHKMYFTEEQFGKKEYFSLNCEKNLLLIETKESRDLKSGDVLIFHCKLLHRANKNSTSKPKISFVYTVKGKRTKVLKGSRSSEYKEILLD